MRATVPSHVNIPLDNHIESSHGNLVEDSLLRLAGVQVVACATYAAPLAMLSMSNRPRLATSVNAMLTAGSSVQMLETMH